MFEIGKQISIDKDIEEKINEIQKRIDTLSIELEKEYKSGAPVEDVLKLKTELESEVYKLDNLNDRGYYVEIEYAENKWSEEYQKVQDLLEKMSEDFVIGDIGSVLRSPLYCGFIITSPYGFRLDPITKDKLSFIMSWVAAPFNDYVFALWNGVVSNVYETEGGVKQ